MGETVEGEGSEGLAVVPNRCISRVRAGTRRITLDRQEVHLQTEVVLEVQAFEAASTFMWRWLVYLKRECTSILFSD